MVPYCTSSESSHSKNSLLYLEMYKRKSGGPSLNGPDAADKMNNSIVIYDL